MSNPAFALSIDDAEAALATMAQSPKPPVRPVVVLGGWCDPGVLVRDTARRLQRVLGDDAPVCSISFFWSLSFASCRRKALARVMQAFPGDDAPVTAEVDVVGYSMGGLVARSAAMQHDGAERLNIKRLFTISTPHRGARLASLAPFDPRVAGMKAGSAFLTALDAHRADEGYPIYPYVRLGDAIVGVANSSPSNIEPRWVPNKPRSLSHTFAGADPRIIADIARRLRNEPAWTAEVNWRRSTKQRDGEYH